MTRRFLSLLLFLILTVSILTIPVSAVFQVTYYNEDVYAGGILDMYAFVGESDLSGYTFRWQYKGLGNNWLDLEDNETYKGTKTNHLQFVTYIEADYTHWDEIPFQCMVTKDGFSQYTPVLYMRISPYENMLKAMKNKGIGLYEPNLSNVTGFSTGDNITYTATAYAGSNMKISCGGSAASQMSMLKNSEVQLKREIKITENGKYILTGDETNYIPYTIGNNAVKIEINMRIIMAGVDRGIYQTKIIQLTTRKPDIATTGKAKSACSLLRYTYNESEKLSSIAKGADLEIIGKTGSYYQVYYNGFVGYVSASLVDADLNDPKIIEHVELRMAEPAADNVWPSSVTVEPTSCFATSVEWYDKTAGKYLASGDRFIKGHDYRLVLWIEAKDGYEFKRDSTNKILTTAILNDNLPCYTSQAYEQIHGKVIEVTYDFNNMQEAEPTTPSQPESPPTQPQHTHTPSAWRTTGAYHYKACTTCGDFLEQEDHTGGVATCAAKGKCTVCGYEYIDVNENHTPDTSKWVVRGDMYHYHACKLCGAHCDIGAHVAGPTGTPDEAVVCKDCGYIITPAKGHTHNLTKVAMVEPTCTKEGRIEYYACDGCSKLFEDEGGKTEIPANRSLSLPALAHSLSSTWECDENFHWHSCTVCRNPDPESKTPHGMNQEKCTVCGYEAGATPVMPTQPATDPDRQAEQSTASTENIQQNDIRQEKATVGPLEAVLIGVVCFFVAITTTVIILKKRGKKV